MAVGAYPSLFYPGQVYPSQPVSGVSKRLPQDMRVEIAFDSGADDPNAAYTDVSSYVDLSRGFSRSNYGRLDQYSTISASQATVGLDNTDGRFSPANASSPYYPNVTAQKRLRVSYRDSSIGGNLLAAEDASFEGGTTGSWATNYLGGPAAVTLANSATHPSDGTKGLLITWPTAAAGCSPQLGVSVVKGRTYTLRAVVWIPAGSPAVRFGDLFGASTTVNSTTTGAFQTLTTAPFVAGATTLYIGVKSLSATTAGQQCYVDAVMLDEGSSLGSFTTTAPPINYRHTGHITSWLTEWPTGGDATSNVTVNSSDRLARLGSGRTLRSIVAEEILYDDPLAYYDLTEPQGSAGAGNTAGTSGGALAPRQVGTGGSVTFAAATGTRFDGASSPTWARASATDGVVLYGAMPVPSPLPVPTLTLRGMFNTTTAANMIYAAGVDLFGNWMGIGTDSSGHAQARMWDPFAQAWVWTLASTGTFNDGHWHDGTVQMSWSAGTVTVTLYVDRVQVATTSYAANGFSVPVGYMYVGGLSGWMWNGSIGHVAFYYGNGPTSTRISQQGFASLSGCAGERTDQRIARLARLAAIDPTEQVLDTGSTTSCAFQDTSGKTALACMQDIATTESGRLFVNGQGLLTFHSRARKWATQTPDVTLDVDVLSPSTGFTMDLQNMANDATAQTPNGPMQRATDSSSQSTYGVMSASQITVYSTADSDALDVISYQVATHSVPFAKTPSATLDMLTTGSTTAGNLLGLELGKRLRVTGLPSQAPASQVDLVIEGWSETWQVDEVSMTPNTVSAERDLPWILEDATYGALDSDVRLIY